MSQQTRIKHVKGPSEFDLGKEYRFLFQKKWFGDTAKAPKEDKRRRAGETQLFERHTFKRNVVFKRVVGSTGPFIGPCNVFDPSEELMYKTFTYIDPFVTKTKQSANKNKTKKQKTNKNKKSQNKNVYNSSNSDYESEGSDASSIITSSSESEGHGSSNKKSKPNRFQSKQTLTKQKKEKMSDNDTIELDDLYELSMKLMEPIIQSLPKSKDPDAAIKYIKIFREHHYIVIWKWKFVEKTYENALSLINKNRIKSDKIKQNKNNPLLAGSTHENETSDNDISMINDNDTASALKNDAKKVIEDDTSKNNHNEYYYHKQYCIYCDNLFTDIRSHWKYAKDTKHLEGKIFVCRFPRMVNGRIIRDADGQRVMCGLRFANHHCLCSHHLSQHSICHRKTRYVSDAVKCHIGDCEQLLQAGWAGNQWKLHCSKHKRKWVPKNTVEQALLNDNLYSNAELDQMYPMNWHEQNNQNNIVSNTSNTNIINDDANTNNNDANTNNNNANTYNNDANINNNDANINNNDAKEVNEYSSSQLSANQYIECGFCHGYFPKNTIMEHMKSHF